MRSFHGLATLCLLSAIGGTLAVLSGCASGGKKTTEYAADRVIARSDELERRPGWVSETTLVRETDGQIDILGVAEVPGDSRPQAAFRMSDAQARGNLAAKLETSVTRVVEAGESGLAMDDQSLKSLVREVSQSTFRNVDIKDRYWEKVAHLRSTGETEMLLKAFSHLQIASGEFKRLLLEATQRSHAASPDLKNKVENILEKQWNDASITGGG